MFVCRFKQIGNSREIAILILLIGLKFERGEDSYINVFI